MLIIRGDAKHAHANFQLVTFVNIMSKLVTLREFISVIYMIVW